MLFLFLISFLYGVLIQERVTSHTIPPVIVESCGCEGSCPSVEEQQTAIQVIKMEVRSILSVQVIPQCGDGLWHRTGYLNMSDTTQQCPQPWREYSINETRACGRPANSNGGCLATFYPTHSQYRRVCGRIIGYQVGSPTAFIPFGRLSYATNFLEVVYVDGVSVTHGSPRSHIWTYAAGTTEGLSSSVLNDCPCHYDSNNTEVVRAPSSIQNSTYCESGNDESFYTLGFLYGSDPLWDGEQCEGAERRCCSDINGNSPPWFSVQLPHPTSDDIEVRICGDQDTHDEDSPISLLELYIQ